MLSIGITSIVFIVASYAWFIGTTQVAVSEFEIGVKSSEGLTISLDGTKFSNTISVSETAVTTDLNEVYSTHTNHWVGTEGLVPISTVGKFNENASTLDLFSKTEPIFFFISSAVVSPIKRLYLFLIYLIISLISSMLSSTLGSIIVFLTRITV